jgi:hypothetical protein
VCTKDSCWSVRMVYDPRGLQVYHWSKSRRGVTNGIRAGPCSFTSVWGLGVWVYGAWCVLDLSGHMAYHMMTLDIHTWPRGEVPGLRLIDEGVSLLRGWIVIS